MAKRYYWLKLKEDFFNLKEIKKLRKVAGGDTYTIIYLKLQLLSLKNEGKLYFDGIEDTLTEELALTLDEEVENIKITLMFLQKHGLIEEVTGEEYILPHTLESIGSETSVAERVRRYRNKNKALQCNTLVTKCNGEIEIEIEKDIEKEKDSKLLKQPPTPYQEIVDLFNSICITLPKVQKLTKSRKAKINARWIEIKDVGIFKELFEKVNKSAFLNGENNRNWKASFDWLITNDSNYSKVLEGNYCGGDKSGFNKADTFKQNEYSKIGFEVPDL